VTSLNGLRLAESAFLLGFGNSRKHVYIEFFFNNNEIENVSSVDQWKACMKTMESHFNATAYHAVYTRCKSI
jgi:hypothetical protein